MQVTRRHFLGWLGAAAVAPSLVGASPKEPDARKEPDAPRTKLIDPMSNYVQNAVAATNRRTDEVLIDAFADQYSANLTSLCQQRTSRLCANVQSRKNFK